MSTIWTFNSINNKHSLYHCMKKFGISVREHTAGVINFEKKKLSPLTEKEIKSHPGSTVYYICRKKFAQKLAKDKNHQKVRDHCHFTGKCKGAGHSICNVRFNVPNEIHVHFHYRSHNDYHFIMKQVANEFKDVFECLGEYTVKYKKVSVSIEKEIKKIDKDGNEDVTTISYKIRFIDSARFMTSSLSNLVDDLAPGIYKIKCKDFNCFFEHESFNDSLIKYK